MARKLVFAATASAALGFGASAGAFWLDAFGAHCSEVRRTNNLWPQQFVGQDRLNAAAPFDVMVRNGWRRQNLLGTHHFNEDCTQLTDSGKLRMQWILTQLPPEHRQVFVERSLKQDLTQARIETARNFAAQVVADGSQPEISETHIVSEGRPAPTVDYVNTQFRENMPVPALPESAFQGSEVAE
ncbi:MAG: hypothetical protein ACRCT8_10845 [Lacipirellulaceae bacterium]